MSLPNHQENAMHAVRSDPSIAMSFCFKLFSLLSFVFLQQLTAECVKR